MQQQIPLEFISKKLIKPSNPTPPNLSSVKISSIDQFHPPLYVSNIFCYPAENKDDRAKFAENIKQLENSLSEILTLFYPLAGRYVKESLSIECNDNGVQFSAAKVTTPLAPLLKNDADSKQLMHLISYQTESATSPLVTVQCNMFECGGLVIGLCISHRIVDATVFYKLLNGWAKACRFGIQKVDDRPRFDLGLLLPTRSETTVQENYLPPVKQGMKAASKTFVFSGLAISKLRKMADRFGLKRGASRLRLVTVVIWGALIRVAQAKHGKLRPSVISHILSLRRKTLIPISDDICGNLIKPVIVRFMPDEKSEANFQDLLFLLREAITKAIEDCGKQQNGDDLFMMVSDAWKNAKDEFEKTDVDAYFFTSNCGMPSYLDFGWGKPFRVSHVQSDVEMIVLMDTRDGDGIEARLCLDENDMQLFEQDPDIMALISQEDTNGGPKLLRSRC